MGKLNGMTLECRNSQQFGYYDERMGEKTANGPWQCIQEHAIQERIVEY